MDEKNSFATMNRRDFLRLGTVAVAGGYLASIGSPLSAFAADGAVESPAYLPATEQIKLFKAGKLSPVDVLMAQIERIKELNGPLNVSNDEPKDFMKFNGEINAITYEHFEPAIKAAKEAEQRYKAGTARPLEGITVAVKDENDVVGWRTTMGSLLLKDAPLATENAAIINMLLEAGAILHIQTTVPEFYINASTWSRLWGVTRNPWNLWYSVGGSSGGSGAALAAGFTTLATGSDMGGSIRVPSSLCGLYGFKAPFGRIPTSETSYETTGPMARNFQDMVLMQNIITGPHPSVHAALRPKLDYPASYDSLKGVKIALDYFANWVPEGVDAAVKDSLANAADVLRGQGAVVEEIDLGWKYKDIFNTFMSGLLSTEIGAMMLEAGKQGGNFTSYAEHFIKSAKQSGPVAMAEASNLATKMHSQLQREIFSKGYSTLIMPTLLTPYVAADHDPTKDAVIINGKQVKGLSYVITLVWNLLSRYPVVDVPVGIAKNQIPMGMQIIGNTFDDLAAFRVAFAYSQAGLQLYHGKMFPTNISRA